MRDPIVTVVTAVYNGADHLRESVQSILDQTFRDFEHIVVDDASTDDTGRILKEFAASDPRIRVVTNERNVGRGGARNAALRLARGEYIAIQDADDVSLPDRLRLQLEFLRARPEVFLAGGAAETIDDQGNKTGLIRPPEDPDSLRRILLYDAHCNPIVHPTAMFRKEGRRFYRGKFERAQDYDFFLCLLTDGKAFANLPQILVRYRYAPNTTLIRTRMQQVLFGRKIREFLAQRLERGADDYERFNPATVLDADVGSIRDPVAIQKMVYYCFECGCFPDARKFIRRYWHLYGMANRLWGPFVLSLFGSRLLNAFRLARRKVVFWGRRGDSESGFLAGAKVLSLGLFLSKGCGLLTWQAVGSLSREVALFKRLASRGWSVTFFTYDRTNSLPDLGFEATVAPQWPYLFPKGLNALYQALLPLLRWRSGRKCTVLMTVQAHSALPAVLASRIWRTKLVVRCGFVYGETAESLSHKGLRSKSAIWLEKWALRRADRCVIPTRDLADWAISNYSLDPARVEVIPNFVDTDVFAPDPDACRDIEVICVGRLNYVKRYDLILDSLKGLDGRVVIIGDGPEDERRQIQEQASALGVNLQMIPRVLNEDLPHYLNRAKVFLIASIREGHPKSLIEAMACGCACLGTRSRGIQNQIVDQETGLLADAAPTALGAAVHRLLRDEDLRQRLGRNARQFAIEHWSFDRVHSQYEGVLESVLIRGSLCRNVS